MKKLIFFLLITGSFQTNGQGLIFLSSEEMGTFTKLPVEEFGFAETLPYTYSLQEFVPPVLKQQGGTCVGFASFYYGLSTMYNIMFNIKDSKEKFIYSFDPYYIYSITFNESNDCDRGLKFNETFDKLMKIGAKKLFYPPFTSCDTKWTVNKFRNTISYTKPYSINTWYEMDVNDRRFLNTSKALISNKIPVIVGFAVVPSMYSASSRNLNGVNSSGLWDPSELEEIQGGHALCVIGYDDYKYGGAFKIVNSWGSDYGENGYMWVKYSDYKEFAREAYVIELNDNVKKGPPAKILQGNYKRFDYRNSSNSLSNYEGQYLNSSVSGYGIWKASDIGSYYVGKFTNALLNGFVLYVNDDGIYSANAVNGKLNDFNKFKSFGFAADEELMETQLEAKRYFSRLGNDLSIRKANSSRVNSTSPPKND